MEEGGETVFPNGDPKESPVTGARHPARTQRAHAAGYASAAWLSVSVSVSVPVPPHFGPQTASRRAGAGAWR